MQFKVISSLVVDGWFLLPFTLHLVPEGEKLSYDWTHKNNVKKNKNEKSLESTWQEE